MMAKKWLCPYRLSVYEFNCNILLWFWEILKCEKTDGSHRHTHTHAHTHIHTSFMSTRDTPIEFIIVFWSFVAPAGGFIATINVNVECSLIFVLFSFHFLPTSFLSFALIFSHVISFITFAVHSGRLYQTPNNSDSPNILSCINNMRNSSLRGLKNTNISIFLYK